jgi:hypothetical protein
VPHRHPIRFASSDPVSLSLGCPHCGVRLRLDLFEWDEDALILTENIWSCPGCGKENRAGLLGTVALVTKDSDGETA